MIGLLLRAKDAQHVAVYSVHEPMDPPLDRVDRSESMVFVRDGFSWAAALFAPIWLIMHGAWVGLGLYVLAASVLGGLLTALGAGSEWVSLLFITLHALVGFEAGNLRRLSLAWAGWDEIATVSGRALSDCERRFFDAWLDGQSSVLDSPAQSTTRGSGSFGDESRLGAVWHWLRRRLG